MRRFVRSSSPLPVFALAGLAALAFGESSAQDGYRLPPEEIVEMVDAPPPPVVRIDPTGKTMLLAQGRSLPTIAELSEPLLRLAGVRISPDTNGPHNPSRYVGLTLQRLADGRQTEVHLPEGASVTMPSWSPDGRSFAFLRLLADGLELWVGATDTGEVRRVTEGAVNATLGSSMRWMADSRHLLVRFVPEGRGSAPERSSVPAGPVLQESSGTVSPLRTFQDLLENAHDEALFDHYMTSQLALVDTETGRRQDIGAPAVFGDTEPSPSGELLLVSRYRRPYSYQVPYWAFPESVEVWTTSGDVVKTLADLPLRDTTPIGGVATGPRSHAWYANRDATVYWIEALDEGDPDVEVPHRDKIMAWNAPFAGEAVELHRIEHRFWNLSLPWQSSFALVREYDRDRRWTRTWLVDVDLDGVGAGGARNATTSRLVFDHSISERYEHPGWPVTMTTPTGHRAVRVDGGSIYLSGAGGTPEGDRPFLRRMDLVSFETEELWRCGDDAYQTVVAVLGGGSVVTSLETPTTPPNYRVRDLASGVVNQLTDFEDPHPQMHRVRKELVTYERDDGVPLSATLYLPPDYEEGERLPLIVWAYPLEYTGTGVAGQVRGSAMRYTRLRGSSHLFMLTQGYAVMDAAAMPVVGDPETVNETFIEQIVAAAQAAIDKAVEMGVADRDRVAVGGHSYGAFMTANLLAHCDLFRAGIARSGAYNRTLTPFGFQAERRTLWEARDTYTKISPFFHADKINEPMLLVHGQNDNNSGTFPMQSERLFKALRGHGATARLVMLPNESHGYRARESVLHVLAEQQEWLDRWVKHPPMVDGQP